MPVLSRTSNVNVGANPKAVAASRFARLALGKPYVWGGTNYAIGVDCSGLCYTAYRMANSPIPRTTYQQWDAGFSVVKHFAELPGDLIFSYPESAGPGHVVMSIGNGQVIAADHTGTVVHIESVHVFDNVYVGSRRPLPATGSPATGAPSVSSAGGDGGGLSSIERGIAWLGSWHTWYRFGLILGGVLAVVGSLYLLVKRTGVV